MSYILDALKKSDQERQQGKGPTLQTVQRPLRSRRAASAVWLTVALALGAALAAGFFGYLSRTPAVVLAPTPIQPAPVVNPNSAPAQRSASAPVAVLAPVDVGTQPPLAFWELPDPVQAEIPAMTFSFHVFSPSPSRRTIIINERRLHEGDAIKAGLLLEEITEQGVVLRWQQHRFYIPVVDNW